MGYSGRYHAASLAAVFVALAIGILIGAALGSDVISGTAESLEESLQEDLNASRARVAELEDELERQREFGDALYPTLVQGRLRGANATLVGLGGLPQETADAVADALEPSGADVAGVAVVREPPDVGGLVGALRSRRGGRESREEAFEAAARRAGRALVGRGRGFDRARPALLSRFSGDVARTDVVVLVRERPEELTAREEAATERLEDGLIAGMLAAGLEPVAVELSDSEESSVEYFDSRELSTVDSVDLLPGKVALVAALAGADGSFGVKETADALLPDLLPPAPRRGAGPSR